MNPEIPERLKSAARTGNLVPFVGAGVSRHAVTRNQRAFPSWTELITHLANAGDIVDSDDDRLTKEELEEIEDLVKRGKFLMAAGEVRNRLESAGKFAEVMNWLFRPNDARPGELHRWIVSLRSPLIVTTNYDTLLEDEVNHQFGTQPEVRTYKEASDVHRYLRTHTRSTNVPLVFKIHGSITHPDEVILAEKDYRDLFYKQPGYRTILSAIFVTRTVLMIGFSFNDPELMVIRESLRESFRRSASYDYILVPRGEKKTIERRGLRDYFGLQVIEYDKTDDHQGLVLWLEELAKYVPGAVTPAPV